jgi:endoglucanase
MKPLLILCTVVAAMAAEPTLEIKVDQVGYPAGMPKIALVVSKNAATEFIVRRADNNREALRGALPEPVKDPDSGDQVRAADFTKLTRDGKYYLDVPGVGRSWTFAIGTDV